VISTKGLFNSDKSDDYLTVTTVKGRNTYPIASREAEQQRSRRAAEKRSSRAPEQQRSVAIGLLFLNGRAGRRE